MPGEQAERPRLTLAIPLADGEVFVASRELPHNPTLGDVQLACDAVRDAFVLRLLRGQLLRGPR